MEKPGGALDSKKLRLGSRTQRAEGWGIENSLAWGQRPRGLRTRGEPKQPGLGSGPIEGWEEQG